jgi:hypothetical protein
MERKDVIERAYQLINEPIDPNLRCPVELVDIVNYKESEAGETVEYFASPAQDRVADDIYAADAAGTITYHKIALKAVLPLTFVGLQSKLETILIDEILNSKDQSALAAKKDGIIRAMDSEEVRRILNLILAVPSQKITKVAGEDLLDVIIRMKQLVSDYATDYVLLVASDVMNEIESYDKENVTNFHYKMNIMDEIAKLGIKKVVKVLGNSGLAAGDTPVIAAGKAILVGRNSTLTAGRPITFLRRKFTKEMAELSGAGEGAVRLIDVAKTPTVVNGAGANTLGYGVFGYESIIQVLTNYRAVSFSENIIAVIVP